MKICTSILLPGRPTRAIANAMAFLLALVLLSPSPAIGAAGGDTPAAPQASTALCGTITADTIWTADASPYTANCQVTVAAGVTLTVEPGVEVAFTGAIGMDVEGTLLAVGTAAQPIVFTAVEKTPGKWVGLTIEGTPTAFNSGSVLDYVTIEYGAYPNGDGNLDVSYASVTISHSTFRYSGEYGIATRNTGRVALSDSTFTGNALGALYFADASVDQALTDLTIQDNGTGSDKDIVVIGGGVITSAIRWEVPAPGVPYVQMGSVDVATGGVLTLDPGVEVRFAGASHTIRALNAGRLIADGTPDQPIIFTGVNKTPGSWDGIAFSGTADTPNLNSRLRYVIIEYGGYSGGNVFIEWANPTISHCTLRYSSRYGVYGRVIAGPRISDTTITDSADYAIYIHQMDGNPAFETLTATNNGPANDRNVVATAGGRIRESTAWQNSGLPYVVLGDMSVEPAVHLAVDPGVEIRYDQGRGLTVYGRLTALGTAQQPITFTGTSTVKGWWDGIRFQGYEDAPSVGSRLDHVTVEYGGADYANLYTFWGQVTLLHSTIRRSLHDGIYAQVGGDTVSIAASRIVENDGYGVRNGDPQRTVVLAANNWWGDASGPTLNGACTTGGTGDMVSAGVDFAPVLTSPTADAPALNPSTLYQLTLEPDRWYVPADGVMVSTIRATLLDGAGHPVPGRTVLATTSLGTVIAGAITGPTGEALILVKSAMPGDALVTARVDQSATPCELIRRATTRITFTPWAAGLVSLTPDAGSPYTTAAIEAGPQPLMRGTPAAVTVTLTNPYAHPILINAVLGVSQSGIGLTHGPIKQWEEVRIEAHASRTLTAAYTPLVAGHWCFYLDYAWYEPADATAVRTATTSRILSVTAGGTASAADNNNSAPAQTNSEAMRQAFDVHHRKVELRNWGEPTTPPSSNTEQKDLNRRINDAFSTTRQVGDAMRGDPPSQDYRTIVTPVKPVMPLYQAGDEGLTAAQAAAANALLDALADAIANTRAVLASDDRYAGAAAAGDQTWAAQQTAAVLYYKEQTGIAYLRIAETLEDWLAVYDGDHVPSVADVVAYQARLAASGFTAEEIAGYTALGCTAEDIEWIRAAFLARDPAEMAVSVRTAYAEAIVDFRTLGNLLAHPEPTFSQQISSVQAAVSSLAATSTANLAAFGDIVQTIEVGNPLTATATIDLSVRRLGIPTDWSVALVPEQLTLAPGAHQPVTVRISPSAPVAQGTLPKLAIEGHVGDLLIGGVEFQVTVPSYVPFSTGYRTFLPLALRAAN